MKPSTDKSLPASPIAARTTPATLYQIFRQTRAGAFVPSFQSDSPVISVESFLRQSSAIEAGELRLWGHRYRRVIVAVYSMQEMTDFGSPVLPRVTIHSGNRHAEIALGIQILQFLREAKPKDTDTTRTD